MPSVKTSVDTATAYKLHQKACRENRTISDVIKRAIINDLAIAPVATPDAAVERHDNGQRKVVGAYLSSTLADAVERLAIEQGRSQSHIMRGLIREALRARGVLPALPEKESARHAD
jgi:hypothetical protein